MANEIGRLNGMRAGWTASALSQPNAVQPATTEGGGKLTPNSFTTKKTTDKASPSFFKNCCAGAHYKTVTLAMRKSGSDSTTSGKPFLVFKFGTVFTTK